MLRYPHAHAIEAQVRLPRSSDKLPPCNSNIHFDTSTVDVGRTRIRATCDNPMWSIRGTVNSKVSIEALIAAQALRKGHRLSEIDYRMSLITLSTPQKPYYFSKFINGRKLKHKLRAGELITYKHIEPDYVVRKGDLVSINYVLSTFSLHTDGIAEENGVIGDLIKVRNSQSGKVLRATVVGNQTVSIEQ